MHLSQIKLTGFKSFVDATNLSFPSHRVGIVGPNGCGKSNIIDAVRWVMGESSAKHLRGAAMTDVIFNGSHTRKPVEQATIELVFAEVNIPQYPPNADIAVKRQLSRDGQSIYFINGVRCRRKDITDLFLGTGLGPRSYAIIEQGMISRLIEAKPEELRILLEEAAGIAKYKERRKETEQRMQQTRDNLARLDEVRNELNKQVDKLKRQAKQAEKYQELKQAEQLLKAQLQALRWYALDNLVQEQQDHIDEQAAILAEKQLALQQFDQTHQRQREAQIMAHHTLTEAQDRCYEVDSEIQRLEQTLQYAQERYEQLQWDLEQLETRREAMQQTLGLDEQQLTQLATEIQAKEIAFAQQQAAEQVAQQAVQEIETQLQVWQSTWEQFNQRAAAPTQQAQVEKTQLQNLEQRLAQNQQRLLRLEEEERHLDIDSVEYALSQLEPEITALNAELAAAQTTLTTYQQAVQQGRTVVQQFTQRLHEQQAQAHKLNGRLASLEVLQEAALGKNNASLTTWLQTQGLDQVSRLASHLQVEAGWEKAVEIVLAEYLQALCVEDLSAISSLLDTPPPGVLTFFATQTPIESTYSAPAPTLLDKVQAPWALTSLLIGVRIAETLTAAEQLRTKLQAHESVVTPQGIWLGSNWVYSQQAINESTGLLAREQEIQQVTLQLNQLNIVIEQLTTELEDQRLSLQEQEYHREQAQQQVSDIHQQLAQLQAQQSAKQARLEQLHVQSRRIIAERLELTEQISDDNQDLETTRHALYTALEAMAQLADERDTLTQQRESLQTTVISAKQTWQTVRENRHQLEIQLESLRTDQNRLQQGINRLMKQLEPLAEQQIELQTQLEKQADPIADWENELADYQQQRSYTQEALLQAKQTVAHLESAVRDYEGEHQRLESAFQTLRTDLEQTRLECQANQVRRQTLEEQLREQQWSPVALVADLPEYADETSWQAQIEAVERKLEQLGAVNLAAMAEFKEQAERKQYLDQQAADLDQALQLLADAIKTIDRETRNRFRQTIDKINYYLQDMFPRLFGGGEAYLRLTDDDILKAGVTIMAQPPGKRNTHIHLLSGGEKTLTAIALVFAIFELNPAPFCMLDEVDAPLDDTNVSRFGTLVKTISERVQFIFISHNKITMEIADQLIGVTMQEPGVSRLVAVDIDMAVNMVKKG
ncbi:MAG: chromosome segregation protein SMC [Thioploca sp.]|nr:chromosome segregation protein SMC [Thioploca sp.]